MMREDIITFPPAPPEAPLRILLAGVSYCDGSYRIRRSSQNAHFYVFEYIVSGRGFLRFGEESFLPAAGDVYIVTPGVDHEYGSSGDAPWVKLWINAEGPLIDELFQLYRLNGVHHLQDCRVKELFESALEKLKTYRTEPEEAGAMLILELILAFTRYVNAGTLHSEEGRKIRQLIEYSLFKPSLPLARIAREIGRSPAQAIRIFRRDFGCTPYGYLLRRKIETAGVLLRNSTKPVKAIAAELGFRDEYYFSNLFKKKAGVSPSAYRKQ